MIKAKNLDSFEIIPEFVVCPINRNSMLTDFRDFENTYNKLIENGLKISVYLNFHYKETSSIQPCSRAIDCYFFSYLRSLQESKNVDAIDVVLSLDMDSTKAFKSDIWQNLWKN